VSVRTGVIREAGRIVHCLSDISWGVVARIFISYATPDWAIADEVSEWLRAAGHKPFLGNDLRNGISVGEELVACRSFRP
jgi:hypothetical protein